MMRGWRNNAVAALGQLRPVSVDDQFSIKLPLRIVQDQVLAMWYSRGSEAHKDCELRIDLAVGWSESADMHSHKSTPHLRRQGRPLCADQPEAATRCQLAVPPMSHTPAAADNTRRAYQNHLKAFMAWGAVLPSSPS